MQAWVTQVAAQGLLAHIPQRFVPLVLTEIETGLRWGELIALRPWHVDFPRKAIDDFVESLSAGAA